MPKEKVLGLFEEIRDAMDDGKVSAQQQMLIDKVEYHIHNIGSPDPEEPNFRQSVEMLVEDLEVDHPKAAIMAKTLLEVLTGMGI